MDIHQKKGELKVLVKWKGFDDEDPRRGSYETMKEDVPSLRNDSTEEIREPGTSWQKKIAATL